MNYEGIINELKARFDADSHERYMWQIGNGRGAFIAGMFYELGLENHYGMNYAVLLDIPEFRKLAQAPITEDEINHIPGRVYSPLDVIHLRIFRHLIAIGKEYVGKPEAEES